MYLIHVLRQTLVRGRSWNGWRRPPTHRRCRYRMPVPTCCCCGRSLVIGVQPLLLLMQVKAVLVIVVVVVMAGRGRRGRHSSRPCIRAAWEGRCVRRGGRRGYRPVSVVVPADDVVLVGGGWSRGLVVDSDAGGLTVDDGLGVVVVAQHGRNHLGGVVALDLDMRTEERHQVKTFEVGEGRAQFTDLTFSGLSNRLKLPCAGALSSLSRFCRSYGGQSLNNKDTSRKL